MTSTRVTWGGQDKRGVNRAGRETIEDVAQFVERRFNAGWRWLWVEATDGTEVGSITRHPDTGRRVWWGEGAVDEEVTA